MELTVGRLPTEDQGLCSQEAVYREAPKICKA